MLGSPGFMVRHGLTRNLGGAPESGDPPRGFYYRSDHEKFEDEDGAGGFLFLDFVGCLSSLPHPSQRISDSTESVPQPSTAVVRAGAEESERVGLRDAPSACASHHPPFRPHHGDAKSIGTGETVTGQQVGRHRRPEQTVRETEGYAEEPVQAGLLGAPRDMVPIELSVRHDPIELHDPPQFPDAVLFALAYRVDQGVFQRWHAERR